VNLYQNIVMKAFQLLANNNNNNNNTANPRGNGRKARAARET